MKKFRTYGILLAILLAACLFNANYGESRFSLDVNSNEMYVSRSVLDYVYNGSYDTRETYQFDLQPGTYVFTLRTESGAGAFEMYSPNYAGEDNTRGVVYVSAEFVEDGAVTVLTFTAEDVIRGARLRVVSEYERVKILGIYGESAGLTFIDPFVVAVVILALAFVAMNFTEKRLARNDVHGLLIFLACSCAAVVATLPIMRFSLPGAHDLTFHLARIEGVYESLRNGQFPARMNTTYLSGYGYADQIMYPNLFLYFPALLRLLHTSPMLSYQLFILAINLATAGTSYFAFKKLTGSRYVAGLASFAFTLCSFRLICVFTRAAVGELLALIFAPLVLLGMYRLIFAEDNEKKPFYGDKYLVIGFSGLVNSHIITLDVAVVLGFIFLWLNVHRLFKGDRIFALLRSAVTVVLLNLWVLLPLVSMSVTGLSVVRSLYDSAGDAVYPFEMFSTFNHALGLSEKLHKAYTAMPLTVGAILGIGVLLFLLNTYVLKRKKKLDDNSALGVRMILLGFTALFISSTLFPWEALTRVPVLGNILCAVQFPWRYFGAASLALCVVLALAMRGVTPERMDKRLAAFVCCVLVAACAAPYIDMYMQNDEQFAILRDRHSQFSVNYIGGREYLRAGTDMDALLARGPVLTSYKNEVAFSDYRREHGTITFSYEHTGAAATYVEAPVYYYPGYRAEAGGADAPVTPGKNGVLRVHLPPESSGSVRIYYEPPVLYRASEAVSLLIAAVLAASFYMRKRRGNRAVLAA